MAHVIDTEEFTQVKSSSEAIKDKDQEWRAALIDYINDISDNNDDDFFYNMLPFVRFIDVPSNEAAAYTTPYKEICMNAPKGFDMGKKAQKWEFVYDHECLHQLWDTFAVADKIKNAGLDYDHELLNIASDCVINDYLHFNRRKKYPSDGLVTPELIKDQFGVDYDRVHDTQYRLYEKILNSPKYKQMQQNKQAIQKALQKIAQNQPNQSGQGMPQPQQGGQQGQQGQQGGQSGQGGQQGQQGQGSQGQSGQGGQGGSQKVSKDYVKGWEKAMADYKAGRLKL